jgi:Ni/Fe-hydrogenase 1 B-type cytochrome subunit
MASIGHRRIRELEALRRPARHTVYAWEWPVRIVHWVIVFALIVLSFTGYYIHHPLLSGAGAAGHLGFTMGLMRFLHEATGFIFVAAVLLRIYCVSTGPSQATAMRTGVRCSPSPRRSAVISWTWSASTLCCDGARRGRTATTRWPQPPTCCSTPASSSRSSRASACFAWIVRSSPWTTLFGWTYQVMSEPSLRLVHFLLMFVYLAFAIFHIYCSILIDIEERNGELSSIITGYKANMLEGEMPRDDPRRPAALTTHAPARPSSGSATSCSPTTASECTPSDACASATPSQATWT